LFMYAGIIHHNYIEKHCYRLHDNYIWFFLLVLAMFLLDIVQVEWLLSKKNFKTFYFYHFLHLLTCVYVIWATSPNGPKRSFFQISNHAISLVTLQVDFSIMGWGMCSCDFFFLRRKMDLLMSFCFCCRVI
jgi:hypothetical protein